MLMFLGTILVIVVSVIFGAKYHIQINQKLNKILNGKDELPPDFRAWIAYHKGEYPTLGQAMSAWADAKYGDRYDSILK